jgi:urease subunit beta
MAAATSGPGAIGPGAIGPGAIGPGAIGPGAIRVAEGTLEINADRSPDERRTLVVVNTGDRPVQIGSHIHLAEVNAALSFDREAATGFRLDLPARTSRRFEPGASREVDIVALRGRRFVPGIQVKPGSRSSRAPGKED